MRNAIKYAVSLAIIYKHVKISKKRLVNQILNSFN